MASSISGVLNIATSGLSVAQTEVTATSDNIANVNTTGYNRKVVTQAETVVGGAGAGVHVASIQNAYNTFLVKANLSATAQAGQTSVVSNFLNQAQQMFGDPSSSTSFFSNLDNVYSAFSAAAATPSSSIAQTDALNALNTFLSSANGLQTNLSGLVQQANQQTSSDVSQANTILSQIAQTNSAIARIGVSGGDTSGLENTLSTLQTQLSGLMQVQYTPDATGGVVVRSQNGTYLAGDQGAATLSFTTVGGGGLLTATPPDGEPAQITAGGGEIAGLMQLSGVQLPQIMSQLSQYVGQAVAQINAASNSSSAVPAPNTLTGTQIGMSLPTAIAGFSGQTTVAITNAQGVMQQSVAITFAGGSGTMNVTNNDGTTSTLSFTPANFLSQLNTALGGEGTASFTNGALSISAAASGDGVAIANSASAPSNNAGSNFAQFFGLNNMVSSTQYANPAGSLTASSPNTFQAGSTLSLELTDATGAAIRQVNLTVPAGATTIGSLINSLNSSVAAYGSFALNAQGQLAFTPSTAYNGTTVSVISDNTVNTAGGPNLSQMLGIGWNTKAGLTSSFSINSRIAANPSLLPSAQLDLTQSVNGGPALGVGDGSGALAIANSGSNNVSFAAAGGLSAMMTSVSNYGSQMAGQVSAMASNATSNDQSAQALLTQATAQLSAADGVNLDNELVNLTTYQQSYNACARLVQASKDMYDVLLQMM